MPVTQVNRLQKPQTGHGHGHGHSRKTTITKAFQQPPFDGRIQHLSSPFGSTGNTPITRGYMYWDVNTPWAPPFGTGTGTSGQTFPKAPKVEFLYNPSTIEASYSLDSTAPQSSLMYPVATVAANLVVPLNSTVSFTIMFDRTYEYNSSWGRDGFVPPLDFQHPTTDMQKFGCWLDILALQQFTGQFSNLDNATQGSGGNNSNPFSGSVSNPAISGLQTNNVADILNGALGQGVFGVALAWCIFSGRDYGLKYYGYISGWDVQFTHFAQNMVPIRAVVDIEFTLLPPSPPASQGKGKGKGKGTNPSVNPTATAVTRIIDSLTGIQQGLGVFK